MTLPASIPQANPGASYRAHQAEIDVAIQRVLDSGRYVLGPEVEAFEREFAEFTGTRQTVAVASGTEALWLALRALDIGPADEVITTSLTAVATTTAIVETGATPVFVDVRTDDLTLDPDEMKRAITPRTRAILPVHLYGQLARVKEICDLACVANIPVLEDCAQAHGATSVGHPAGSWGQIAAFSFYPTKNLGAIGDGGAIVTTFPALAEKVRLLREYGWRQRYVSAAHGWNSRLDEMQAAILRVKLRHLPQENRRRAEIAVRYNEAFVGTSLRLPATFTDRGHVYHQYVVRHPERDRLREALARQGIGTAVHYPAPVHLQDAYRALGGGPGSLPVTEQAAREVFSLPIYPELTEAQVERVCRVLCEAIEQIA
jgi:dTDP-3-amino-3,4,6-trideoxy-alpha-D-glucose transaminase